MAEPKAIFSGSPTVERAELIELDADFAGPLPQGHAARVQFNPETLKVSFANQIVQGSGAGDQRGTPTRQFVGAGTTKLALQVWFDVTGEPNGTEPTDDVRKLTEKVAYFITPKKLPQSQAPQTNSAGDGGQSQQPTYAPPAVRFLWGSFQFDGIMEQLEETLEFWSPDGRPLRASLSLTLSQQKITFAFNDKKASPASAVIAGLTTPGTRPLTRASVGATLPELASMAGAGSSWQSIAVANGIEDPLRLTPGQLVDMSARAPRGGPNAGIR